MPLHQPHWPPHCDSICYANIAFSNRFRRHLWTDLYETLTHDAYRLAIEHYEEILGYCPPPKKGPKLPIFDDFTTQWQIWGLISPARNMMYIIWKRRWKPRRVHYIIHKFHELNNKFIIMTHPPKWASAWRRQPSRWPAFRRANISSYYYYYYYYYYHYHHHHHHHHVYATIKHCIY